MITTKMRTLLDERYAPLTRSIGFLEIPIGRAADAVAGWRRGLGDETQVFTLEEPFPLVLHRLEPLTIGVRPRELLVATRSRWTALQAQIELSLPAANTATAVFAIETAALDQSLILKIGTVAGNVFARGGGGLEIVYESRIPAQLISRTRCRQPRVARRSGVRLGAART